MAVRALAFYDPKPVNLGAITRRYFVRTFNAESFQLGGAIHDIILAHGSLSVDGVAIAKPQFGTRSISWSQEAQGHFSSGRLFLDRQAIELHGVISTGASAKDAAMLDVFASAVPPSTYSTHISTTRLASGSPGALPQEQWTTGLEFQLGYQYQPGQSLPTLVASLAGQDYSPYIALNVTADDLLQVVLTGNTAAGVICEFDPSLYLSGTITFSAFGDTFSGAITATCADPSGTGAYFWKGVATNNLVLQQRTEAPVHLVAAAMAAAPPQGLSLADLISLAPDDSVGQMSNAMLVENMKWVMGQADPEKDWLQTFFAQTPPALPRDRIDLVNQDLAWYRNQLAPAYMTWGIATATGPAAPSITLNPTQKQNLETFLMAGLGKQTQYTRQMTPLYTAAYQAAKPRIQLYINDTQGNWAQHLFAFLTTSAQLNMLVNRAFSTHDVSASNHFAAMLNALDPTGNLTSRYQRAFLSRMLLQSSLNAVVLDQDVAMTWVPQAMDAFIQLYATPPGTAAVAGEPPSDAQQAADDLLKYARAVGGSSAAAMQITNILIQSLGSSVADQGQKAAAAFAEKFPQFSKAANALLFIVWVGGVFQVIVSFVKFGKLTDVQRASTINNCVMLVNRAAGQVVNFFKGRFDLNMQNQLNNAIGTEPVLQEAENTGAGLVKDVGIEEDWVLLGTDQVVSVFDVASQEVRTAGTSWENFFAAAPKVVAVIGIVTTAVAAVLATITFVRDVQSGKPVSQQALDGIAMAATWVQGVAMTVGLFVAEAVCAIAAAILAIVGLIVALIAVFKPAPPANDKSNQFMQQTGIAFANDLGDQSVSA